MIPLSEHRYGFCLKLKLQILQWNDCILSWTVIVMCLLGLKWNLQDPINLDQKVPLCTALYWQYCYVRHISTTTTNNRAHHRMLFTIFYHTDGKICKTFLFPQQYSYKTLITFCTLPMERTHEVSADSQKLQETAHAKSYGVDTSTKYIRFYVFF